MSDFKLVQLTDKIQIVNIGGDIVPRGEYDNSTDYAVGDLVSYLGSSYLMYADAPSGTLPTDDTKWMIVAEKGEGGAGPKGDTGSTGAKGDTGTSGSAGAKGDTGASGSAGSKGDTGSSGSAGAKGDTGSAGSTGAKGDTGSSGSAGAKGDTGSAGTKGDTGVQGDTGSGAKGDTGSGGAKGDTGSDGVRGNPGTEGELYTYDSATTDSDPGSGKICFNNATIASVTQIYIDLLNNGGADVTSWLDSLDDGSSAIKAVLNIRRNDSFEGNYAKFYLNSITTATGYRKLNVTYIASAGSFNTNGGNTLINVERIGDKGDTGSTGSQGIQGDTGATGSAGAKGDTGSTGSAGAKGDTGTSGSAGAKGDTGSTGSTGAKGDTGSTGSAGAKGDTGSTGSTGAKGDTGSAGAKGDTGASSIGKIVLIIDGQGSVITTGVKAYLRIPFTCTINSVSILEISSTPISGSIVIDIWKDTYANYPPTVADTITASAKPTLSSATKSEDTTLTGWTTSITAGDVLGFNVDSASSVKKIMLELKVTQ